MDLCRHRYSTNNAFRDSFLPQTYEHYLNELGGREGFITNEAAPTLTIAKHAFGVAKVNELLAIHLQQLASAFGIKTDPVQIDAIADDIISGYGDLKITEIMLFFKMLREGRFRSGDNDRGKMFGTLSSETICDCLYKYRFDYRNEILRKHEEELNKQKREEAAMRQATQEEKFQIFLIKCLQDFSFIELIKSQQWLMEKEIQSIERTIDEFKALRQFYKVGKEFIDKVNNGCDPKTAMKRLEKGVNYIQTNIYNERQ